MNGLIIIWHMAILKKQMCLFIILTMYLLKTIMQLFVMIKMTHLVRYLLKYISYKSITLKVVFIHSHRVVTSWNSIKMFRNLYFVFSFLFTFSYY
jgi:hypothetical protein